MRSSGNNTVEATIGLLVMTVLCLAGAVKNYSDLKVLSASHTASVAAAADTSGTIVVRGWLVGPQDHQPLVYVREWYKRGKNSGWRTDSTPAVTVRITDDADRSVVVLGRENKFEVEGGVAYPDPAHWSNNDWRLRGYAARDLVTVVCHYEPDGQCYLYLVSTSDRDALIGNRQAFLGLTLFGAVVCGFLFVVFGWAELNG